MNMNALTSKNAGKCIIDGSEEVVDAAHDVIKDTEPQESLGPDLWAKETMMTIMMMIMKIMIMTIMITIKLMTVKMMVGPYLWCQGDDDDDYDDDHEDNDDDTTDNDKADDSEDDGGPLPVVPGRQRPAAVGGRDRSCGKCS